VLLSPAAASCGPSQSWLLVEQLGSGTGHLVIDTEAWGTAWSCCVTESLQCLALQVPAHSRWTEQLEPTTLTHAEQPLYEVCPDIRAEGHDRVQASITPCIHPSADLLVLAIHHTRRTPARACLIAAAKCHSTL
jgi:hypothetical protein